MRANEIVPCDQDDEVSSGLGVSRRLPGLLSVFRTPLRLEQNGRWGFGALSSWSTTARISNFRRCSLFPCSAREAPHGDAERRKRAFPRRTWERGPPRAATRGPSQSSGRLCSPNVLLCTHVSLPERLAQFLEEMRRFWNFPSRLPAPVCGRGAGGEGQTVPSPAPRAVHLPARQDSGRWERCKLG
jgi:hypothetical protein